MTGSLRYEVREGIGYLTFDRPQARNAMTFAMYEQLYEIAERVNADIAVRAVILTGATGAFVAGTDITEFNPWHRIVVSSVSDLSHKGVDTKAFTIDDKLGVDDSVGTLLAKLSWPVLSCCYCRSV